MQSTASHVARRLLRVARPARQCVRTLSSNHGSNEWRRAKRVRSLVQQYNQQQLDQQPVRIPAVAPLPTSTPSPSPFAASPAASELPADVALPHTCLGCGAALQTEYEHEAGYIEQSSVDHYVEQLSTALQPHLHASSRSARRDTAETAAIDAEEGAEAEAKATPAVTVLSNTSEQEQAEDGEAAADGSGTAQPASMFDSEAEWQNAWRRGEIGEADLQAHNIDVITPRQLKQQLAQLRTARHTPPSTSLSHSAAAALPKPLRCVRCFQLTHYGHTRGNIATAISSDFRALLHSRFLPSPTNPSPPSAVVLLLVDILDVHSSLPPWLPALLGGRNPIVLVANKRDLLPQSYGPNRLLAWLKAEGRRYGVHYHSVQLVSAKTGEGVPGLMRKAGELAAREGVPGRRDIYLVGAVNTGKSSLINRLQEMRYAKKGELASSSAVTSSIYPGTTLGLVAFPLIPARDGTVYDTPGVLSHPLSSVLTHAELKAILPTRPLQPVTYRLSEGQSILLGGMARVDHVAGRPFLYTVYVSGGVTVHVTNAAKLDADGGAGMADFYRRHSGGLVAPPFSYERYVELGLGRGGGMTFELRGRGWEEACDDIVLPGLGWLAVTGVGDVKVRVLVAGTEATEKEKQLSAKEAEAGGAPGSEQHEAREAREERVLPFAREPLMPLDARKSMRKFHGSDTRQNRRVSVGAGQKKMQQRGFHSFAQPARTVFTALSACVRHLSTSFSRATLAAQTEASDAGASTNTTSAAHATPSLQPPPASANPPSSSPPAPSTAAPPSLARRSLSSYGRPQWAVYKQLLARQSASVQQAYRATPEYVRAPKGSWRVQDDGRLVKLFRWRDKWQKGGRIGRQIEARRRVKEQRHTAVERRDNEED